jgi:hypothetical protein
MKRHRGRFLLSFTTPHLHLLSQVLFEHVAGGRVQSNLNEQHHKVSQKDDNVVDPFAEPGLTELRSTQRSGSFRGTFNSRNDGLKKLKFRLSIVESSCKSSNRLVLRDP